jgi:hypothetical protein
MSVHRNEGRSDKPFQKGARSPRRRWEKIRAVGGLRPLRHYSITDRFDCSHEFPKLHRLQIMFALLRRLVNLGEAPVILPNFVK